MRLCEVGKVTINAEAVVRLGARDLHTNCASSALSVGNITPLDKRAHILFITGITTTPARTLIAAQMLRFLISRDHLQHKHAVIDIVIARL